MATKFFSGAGGTYTLTSRKITGPTAQWTGGAPAAADIGKPISFWTTAALTYTAIIEAVGTVLTDTEVTVRSQSSLPPGNTSITLAAIPDMVTTHSYADYMTEIGGNIQDDAAKLTTAEIEAALRSAVVKFGEDEPWIVAKRVQGNGTKEYLLSTALAGLWKHGDTSILSIEYPDGGDPPEMLEMDQYGIYDDGTAQDGSNLTLRFLDVEPGTTEYFVVRLRIENSLTGAGQNFPDTAYNFRAICLLASSYACRRLAAAYAQSTDSTITADSVNYHEKMDKYLRLATYYQEEYNRTVFGTAQPTATVQAATVEKALETTASDKGPYLFHPRSS